MQNAFSPSPRISKVLTVKELLKNPSSTLLKDMTLKK
jgi:hypothetical protein